MTQINDILKIINENIKSHYFKDITTFETVELISRNGSDEKFPAKFEGSGNYEFIQTDTSGLIVYHRIASLKNEDDLDSGFGRNSLTKETYDIKTIFFGSQNNINQSCENINFYLAQEFKKLIPRNVNIKDRNSIKITGIGYDREEIKETEFIQYNQDSVLFSLDLEITVKRLESCKDLNCSTEPYKHVVTIYDNGKIIEKEPVSEYTCSSLEPKAGIQYQRPQPKNIILSQQLYDEAWHYANGSYNYTNPSNPISCAALDWSSSVPFLNLINDNAFGNKERFTDELGTQVYANNYVVDNLTGLGWMTDLIATNTWVNHLNNSNTFELTSLGYSDFRVPNYNEWNSISFISTDKIVLRYQPFGITSNSIVALSTNSMDATRFYIAYNYYGQILRTGFSTTNYNTMYLRTHF